MARARTAVLVPLAVALVAAALLLSIMIRALPVQAPPPVLHTLQQLAAPAPGSGTAPNPDAHGASESTVSEPQGSAPAPAQAQSGPTGSVQIVDPESRTQCGPVAKGMSAPECVSGK